MKCIHCAVANMPGANFCQGCGRPLSAEIEPNKATQSEAAQPARQHVCFRCSAPLAADAKVCDKCGLNVENLINPPPASQLPAGKAADLAEVTFFSQPPPSDPQLAALKTYATWFAATIFAVIASFSAYSWLEASNVIGRLIGENAAKSQVQALEPLHAANSQGKAAVPSFIKTDAQGDVADVAAPDADTAAVAAPVETRVAKSAEADKAPSGNTAAKKPRAKAKTARSSGSAGDDDKTAPASNVLPPLPAAKPEMETAQQQLPMDNPEQAYAPEAIPAQPEAESSAATASPAPQAKPRKRVIVTQIEPNKNKRSAPAVSPVEDFFRRWKKSIKQGVSDRPCTQQERALNQCYD